MTNDACTPGNCVAEGASYYTIYGGASPISLTTWAPTNPTWHAKVSAVHPNPGYNGSTLADDDAILILTGMTADSGSVPSPMAWQSSVDDTVYAPGISFKAVGYGITSGTSNNAGAKRSVILTIQGNDGPGTFLYGTSTHDPLVLPSRKWGTSIPSIWG